MSYNPNIKLYYLKNGESPSESNRIVPAPQLSIEPEYLYSNDSIIGYTYNINLSGYATSIDLTKNSIPDTPGFKDVLTSIQKIKNIFNGNNGVLRALDNNNQLAFEFIGSTVRNLNFNESNNNWVNYSEYSIDIEFNEIRLGSCEGLVSNVSCSQIPSGIQESPELVDMKKHKIKSFNDSWGLNLAENIYNRDSSVRNEHFEISYSLKAVGKHYFVGGLLIPAWEQAKKFVEDRLKKQINNLANNILKGANNSACSPSSSLSSLFSAGQGVLDLGSDHKIYNETVTINTSESEGSFSIEYNAIIKKNISSPFASADTIHTYNVTTNINNNSSGKKIAISVSGNIQGLIDGGIAKFPSIFNLPNNGTVIVSPVSNISNNKYTKALTTLNLISTSDRKKLNFNFSNFLGISYANLGVDSCSSAPPDARSFNVSHDYINGSISYSCEYDSDTSSCSNYQSATITVQDPTPIIAEFIVPGRSNGPIIQRVNANTPKKITLSLSGANTPVDCCSGANNQLIEGSCQGIPNIPGVPSSNLNNAIMTRNFYEIGNDGSYSLTREYIICNQ
jgi:hypothetical protein